ncbi:hypothetical protein DFA_07391 [Cavenderia fasciculata]|uniref:Uncharacterized protein n=1 Tax=Cavenderia fasciculata TaxID=261658 RepID=F4PWA4_CACFS|nr:uncharacterized protein DFA_07391 [Cavenderia fasciculata]EGG20268.1 hypothetical protein DFA_07391 [Cavenderia fasciculata]|eukprot:XP_004367251.1 hypothetical protein DFA_07391 [Cavenderia fasciculata]
MNSSSQNQQQFETIQSCSIILSSIAEVLKDTSSKHYNLSKILVNNNTESSDIRVILEYLDINHPIATFIKNYIQSIQDVYYYNNGLLKYAIILASTLLKRSLPLLQRGLDLNSVIQGCRISIQLIQHYLQSKEFIDQYNKHQPLQLQSSSLHQIVLESIEKNDYKQLIDIIIIDEMERSKGGGVDDIGKKAMSTIINQSIIELKSNNKDIKWSQLQDYFMFIKDDDESSLDSSSSSSPPSFLYNINNIIKSIDGMIYPLIPCNHIINNNNNNNSSNSKKWRILFYNVAIEKSKSKRLKQEEIMYQTLEQIETWKKDEEREWKDYVENTIKHNNIDIVMTIGEVDPIALHYFNLNDIQLFKNVNPTILKQLAKYSSTSILLDLNNNTDKSTTTTTTISFGTIDTVKKYSNNNNNNNYYYFHTNNNNTIKTIKIKENNHKYQQLKKYGETILYNLSTFINNEKKEEEEEEEVIYFNDNISNLLSNHLKDRIEDYDDTRRFTIQTFIDSLSQTSTPTSSSSPFINNNILKKVYQDGINLVILLLNAILFATIVSVLDGWDPEKK